MSSQPTGVGQKIGLVEFDNFNRTDVSNWLTYSGMSTSQMSQLSTVDVNGGTPVGGAGGTAEVLLDVDTVMGIATGANYVVYDAPNGSTSTEQMLSTMINDNDTLISDSWSYCESQTTQADVTSIDSIIAGAAASGVYVFAATGDTVNVCDGSSGAIAVPADSPNAIAVGGTSLTLAPGEPDWQSEIYWDINGTGAGGGFGSSVMFPAPAYQFGLYFGPWRDVPDVAAVADPKDGIPICQSTPPQQGLSGGCPVTAGTSTVRFGGTSLATPIWAAGLALINQQAGRLNANLKPALYNLVGPPAFHGISHWDAEIGLGSFDLGQLYAGLFGTSSQLCTNLQFTAAPSGSVALNAPLTWTASVSGCANPQYSFTALTQINPTNYSPGAFSSNPSFTYSPTNNGFMFVEVRVRPQGSSSAYALLLDSQPVLVGGSSAVNAWATLVLNTTLGICGQFQIAGQAGDAAGAQFIEAVGSSVSVTAVPCFPGQVNGDNSFQTWTIFGASCAGGPNANPCSFTMPATNVSLTATFQNAVSSACTPVGAPNTAIAQLTYCTSAIGNNEDTVTLDWSDAGTGTYVLWIGTAQGSANYATDTVTGDGFQIVGLVTSTTYYLRLFSNIGGQQQYNDYQLKPTVYAGEPQTSLTLTSTGCGSTNPRGTIWQIIGATVTITATPCDANHGFGGWNLVGDSCTGGEAAETCTLILPDRPLTLGATFAPVNAPLSVTTTGCGAASPSGTVEQKVGSAVSIVATPCDSGHVLGSWSVTGASCSGGALANPCTFAMPGSNVTVVANFVSAAGGSGNACLALGTPSASIAQSSTCTYLSGNLMLSWNAVGSGTYYVWLGSKQGLNDITDQAVSTTSFSMSGLTAPALYIRLYSTVGNTYPYNEYTVPDGVGGSAVSYMLSVSSTGCGSTTPTGTVSHSAGDAISVAAAPCDGSQTFTGWSITGASCTAGLSMTPCAFSMPAGNVTLAATFAASGGGTGGGSSSGCSAISTINTSIAQFSSCSYTGGTVSLAWNAAGSGTYYIWLGSSQGTNDITDQMVGTTTFSMSGLTAATLYIRLYSTVGGAYPYNEYSVPN